MNEPPIEDQILNFEAGVEENTPEINIQNTLLIEEKLWSSLESIRLLEVQNQDLIAGLKQEHKSRMNANTISGESDENELAVGMDVPFEHFLNLEMPSSSQINDFAELSKLAETWWETTHTHNLNVLEDLFPEKEFKR